MGATSWAAAWWTRSTICAPPIRHRTRNCSARADQGLRRARLRHQAADRGYHELRAPISCPRSQRDQSEDKIYYSKYIVKRLPAEVLLDAMSQVTGVATSFPGYPAGTRALQLPDTQVQSRVPDFVRKAQAHHLRCGGALVATPTVSQALHVINGDTLNKKLSAPDGYASLCVKLGISDTRILEQSIPRGLQPVSDRRGETGDCVETGRNPQCEGIGRRAERSPAAGARRHGVGPDDQQGIPVQPLMRTLCLLAFTLPAIAQDYTREVRPIFEKYCFTCHSSGVKMGVFELGTYQELMKGGHNGQAVVPGNSGESRLYQMVYRQGAAAHADGRTQLAAGRNRDASKVDRRRRQRPCRNGACGRCEPGNREIEPSQRREAADRSPWRWRPVTALRWPWVHYQKVRSDRARDRQDHRRHSQATPKRCGPLAFSRDGKILAAAGGLPGVLGEVKIWDRRRTKTDSAHLQRARRLHLRCGLFAGRQAHRYLQLRQADQAVGRATGKSPHAEGPHRRDLRAGFHAGRQAPGFGGGRSHREDLGCGYRRAPLHAERAYSTASTRSRSPDRNQSRRGRARQDASASGRSAEKAGTLLTPLIAHEDADSQAGLVARRQVAGLSSSADRTIKIFKAAT